MKVTDTLSQAALQDNTPEISDKEMNYIVHFVVSSLSINEKTRKKQVGETVKYYTLQKLHQISTGWPEYRLKLAHTITITQWLHTKIGFFSRANKS